VGEPSELTGLKRMARHPCENPGGQNIIECGLGGGQSRKEHASAGRERTIKSHLWTSMQRIRKMSYANCKSTKELPQSNVLRKKRGWDRRGEAGNGPGRIKEEGRGGRKTDLCEVGEKRQEKE